MQISTFIKNYERDLQLKNYAKNSIKNYVSQIGSFLSRFIEKDSPKHISVSDNNLSEYQKFTLPVVFFTISFVGCIFHAIEYFVHEFKNPLHRINPFIIIYYIVKIVYNKIKKINEFLDKIFD